jgi:hypothetical protein
LPAGKAAAGPPPPAPQPASVDAAVDAASAAPADEPPDERRHASEGWWLQVPSWLASMFVHLALVLLLALVSFGGQMGKGLDDLFFSVRSDGLSDVEHLDQQMMEAASDLEQAIEIPAPDLTTSPKLDALAGPIGLVKPEAAPGTTGLPAAGGGGDALEVGGNGLQLRLDAGARERMLLAGGGTRESEEAVQRALYWLAEHQNYDGSWSFEHQKSPKCRGACNDPGFTPGKIAATALALLPYLGTGQTHKDGAYKRNIELGLKFLVSSVEKRGDLGSLFEQGGQMYGHGLATIALCEAYGMTRDRFLKEPAQACIHFIAEAQDPLGGGWRYLPRQPGDTSVVGWQVMALKSAQMAYLNVPDGTLRKASYFLDRVQGDKGAVYGYQQPERGRPATTAIGLLCRMYMGWRADYQPLERGVHGLSALGPSTDTSRLRNNMYYNYYATQVMHHFGGPEWERWNKVLRDYLVESQQTKGHERGSWFFDGNDLGAPAGGRLYCTAMAAMTLEVYYRYMPLYRPQSTAVPPSQQP